MYYGGGRSAKRPRIKNLKINQVYNVIEDGNDDDDENM
jgi:hypothetical protein